MDKRTCKHCDGPMPASYPNRTYCTAHCRNAEGWTRRKRIPCSQCGGPTGWKLGRADVDADTVRCTACRVDAIAGQCEHCDATFASVKTSRGARTRFCSKSCARRSQIASGGHPFLEPGPILTDDERRERSFLKGERARRKRRARLAEVESEPYTLKQIAERDGYRCGLCGEEVDMTLKHPHPESASVDHILPLSLPGATDLKTNVRLAHLGENLARGNRVDWVPDVAS